jgi:hypothetical protein
MIRALVVLSVFTGTLFAQRSVPPEYSHHHVWAVVPLIGAGTDADPRRPLFVPAPSQQSAVEQPAAESPDLLSYQMQLSDDGKWALVEFVFRSPLSFHNFLAQASTTPNLGVIAPALQAISSDGSDLKALPANIAALKSAFASAIPGLQLFERGKATPAEILTAFRQRKVNYTFSVVSGAIQ